MKGRKGTGGGHQWKVWSLPDMGLLPYQNGSYIFSPCAPSTWSMGTAGRLVWWSVASVVLLGRKRDIRQILITFLMSAAVLLLDLMDKYTRQAGRIASIMLALALYTWQRDPKCWITKESPSLPMPHATVEVSKPFNVSWSVAQSS